MAVRFRVASGNEAFVPRARMRRRWFRAPISLKNEVADSSAEFAMFAKQAKNPFIAALR
jgi:hypothetical protein